MADVVACGVVDPLVVGVVVAVVVLVVELVVEVELVVVELDVVVVVSTPTPMSVTEKSSPSDCDDVWLIVNADVSVAGPAAVGENV